MNMLRSKHLTYLVLTLILSSCVAALIFPQIINAAEPLIAVSTSAPQYGAIAIMMKAKGTVVVTVAVDSKGHVISANAIEGHALLRRSAENAAKLWKFNPAPNSEALRSAKLTFTFDIQFPDSTETKEDAVFIPPYRMEIIRKLATIVPLTRVNGQIPEERCPLHGEIMKLDVVPILYGLPPMTIGRNNVDVVSIVRNAWEKITYRETYEDARYKKFPYSNMTAGGGCIVGYESKAEMLYCPKCRAIEMKWRKKHPGEGPRVVAFISGR